MQTMKKHWTLMTLLCLGVIGLGAWGWQRVSIGAAVVQGPPMALNAVEYSAILTLLEELSLDRDALVALNLSEAQAGTLLGDVRTWYSNNAATLQTLQLDIDAKTLALRQIEQAIAMGPFDPEHAQALADARQDLATAQAAYDAALTSVRQTVFAGLSASQQATWTAIQSGHGQSMPLRMLDLTDTQRVALSKAWRRYRSKHAVAEDSEARAAAVAAWQTELNTILTAEQQTVVSSYHSNYDTASGAVASAWSSELEQEGGG